MRKDILNKFFKKFGVEIHGIGYLEKLRNSSIQKSEWDKQFELARGRAQTIFDVGANVGTSTEKYAKLFPKAKIHSFEPHPASCQGFKDRNHANPNVFLNEYALSGAVGKAMFNVNSKVDTSSFFESQKLGIASDKNCETLSQIEMRTNTLDNYCSTNGITGIDILKIDVQGFELEVLSGAKQLLQNKAVKVIYLEMFFQQQYKKQPLFFDIAKMLYDYDFTMQDIYDPYYSKFNILWCDAIFIPKPEI